MSGGSWQIARQRIAIRANSHHPRLLEERLLRFPRLVAFLVRRGQKLPPGSRLRKRLIRRALLAGIAALNRGEPERAFSIYHPDCELVVAWSGRALGLEGARGREDRIRFQREWNAEWGEFRFEPEELIDFGDDRGLVLGRVKGSGRSSGAGFDSEWAALLTVLDGWILREQAFFDHAEALEAAGLSE